MIAVLYMYYGTVIIWIYNVWQSICLAGFGTGKESSWNKLVTSDQTVDAMAVKTRRMDGENDVENDIDDAILVMNSDT